MKPRRPHALLSALIVLLLLSGCGEGGADIEVVSNPTDADRPETIDSDSQARRIEQFTYRVRNVNCSGLAVGTGFAVDRDTIVTNRHVAAGAERIELNTWTGDLISARVEGVATVDDLALVTVSRSVPEVADLATTGLDVGDTLLTAGYPGGHAYQLSTGTYLGMREGPFGGDRLTIDDERSTRGNSGGPVMDEDGRVVGILTEGLAGSSTRFAIPVELVRSMLDGQVEPPTPC